MISTVAGIISLRSQKNDWNNSNKRTGGKKEKRFMYTYMY